ncbi:MAG: hypothetical protein PVG42_11655 [Lysobacterales bacterium]
MRSVTKGRSAALRLAIGAGLATVMTVTPAHATLCKPDRIAQRDRTEAKRVTDAPFGQGRHAGEHDYNARVIGCNRWRDDLGYDVDQTSPVKHEYDDTLSPRIIKGHIRYFNVANMRYGYALERQGGDWIVTVAARFHFPSKKFPKRLDIPMELAQQLGIAQQSCATTERKGLNIVGGLVVVDDYPDACRLERDMVVHGTPITEHLMEYWRDAITRFWSQPGHGFEVHMLIDNLGELSDDELKAFKKRNAVWHIRLNHNKNSRAMYRASIGRPHPLYAGTDAAVIVHEFGHVLGLDDEYPGSKHPPDYRDCMALGGDYYAMCDMPPADWEAHTGYAKGVYAWIATRRYGVGKDTDLHPWGQRNTSSTTSTSALSPQETEANRSASGEYVAPPPTGELVSQEARDLARSDPTESNAQISPRAPESSSSVENLHRRSAQNASVGAEGGHLLNQPDLASPTRQRPAAADDPASVTHNASDARTARTGEPANPPGTQTAFTPQEEAPGGNVGALESGASHEADGSSAPGGTGGSLIGYFPLDGSPANTQAKGGKIYADEGAEPRVVPGKFGRAYLFERQSVIAAPLDIDFETHPEVTVTAWVRYSGDDAEGFILSSGPGSNAASLRLSNERVRGHSAGSKPVLHEGEKIEPDTWTFVAGIWDFDQHVMRLYKSATANSFANPDLDVAEQSAMDHHQPRVRPPDADKDDTEPQRYVFIGAIDFNGGWFAQNIAIDDVRIYDGALDDQSISAIRDGGPIQVSGSRQIGETEKNLSADTGAESGSSTVPGVPSSVSETADRMARSDTFQDVAEAQRQRHALEESLHAEESNTDQSFGTPSSVSETADRLAQSDTVRDAAAARNERHALEDSLRAGASDTDQSFGTPSSVSETADRLAQSDVAQDAAASQSEGQDLIEALNSGNAAPGTGSDNSDDTGSGDGTELTTQRQPLEAAAKLQYGDRVYRIGDISGSRGSYDVTKTFYAQQAVLTGLDTTEHSDKPCIVKIEGRQLAGGAADSLDVDKCEGGSTGVSMDNTPGTWITDANLGIVRLQVCRSGLKQDKRVKGFRVTTKEVHGDGSLSTNSEAEVLLERANCGVWEDHSVCEDGTVATGVKLYFSDGTQLAPRDYLTGVALMCSQLQPVE